MTQDSQTGPQTGAARPGWAFQGEGRARADKAAKGGGQGQVAAEKRAVAVNPHDAGSSRCQVCDARQNARCCTALLYKAHSNSSLYTQLLRLVTFQMHALETQAEQ